MKYLLLLLVPLAAGLSWHNFTNSEKEEMFKMWTVEYGRDYTGEEYQKRFDIFLQNAELIYIHNEEADMGAHSYRLGVNQFADMTGEEFRNYVHGGDHGYCLHPSWKEKSKSTRMMWLKQKLGLFREEIEEKLGKKKSPNAATVDWTTKGVVTPVKNQGQCGSCWAFSTTGSIESAYAIKYGKLVSLSEQELVDCSRSYGNNGCQGGLMDNAFKYVEANRGLCSETEYPYTAKNGQCQSSKCTTRYDTIAGYQDVTRDSETALEEAVAKGPVSIAIEADQQSFQFYKSGVLTASCGTRLDHGVLVVGYGTDKSIFESQQYWKVKNSWGASWGENGYIRLCKDCKKNGNAGECGILMQPSYPTE